MAIDQAALLSENHSLRHALGAAADHLNGMADRLDEWAAQSLSGGWSTHQVDANRAMANEARRCAAQLRRTI